MASVTMAGPALRPCTARIQHRQTARPSAACRAVMRPVAQQTQQQRKVSLCAEAVQAVHIGAIEAWLTLLGGQSASASSRHIRAALIHCVHDSGTCLVSAIHIVCKYPQLAFVRPHPSSNSNVAASPQAALAAGVSALSIALAPAAMAAQEAMIVAEVSVGASSCRVLVQRRAWCGHRLRRCRVLERQLK